MSLTDSHQSFGLLCGGESIKAVFLLGKHEEDDVMEYLMRRYKGRFYRPRYPTLTVVN
jgi:hypothetical protein